MTETETKPKRITRVDRLANSFDTAWCRINWLRVHVEHLQKDLKALRQRVEKLEKLLEEPQPLKPS